MDFKSALVIILSFIAFFAFLTIFLSNRYKQMADAMISQYWINTQFAISNVLADVYTMGRPPGFDHFKRCNIYFIENGILLVGYSQFWNKKIYAKPLILLKDDAKINNVNPNSFNGEVYIEIIYVSKNFQQSAEIRLKGLSDQDRNLFNVLV